MWYGINMLWSQGWKLMIEDRPDAAPRRFSGQMVDDPREEMMWGCIVDYVALKFWGKLVGK